MDILAQIAMDFLTWSNSGGKHLSISSESPWMKVTSGYALATGSSKERSISIDRTRDVTPIIFIMSAAHKAEPPL